MALCNALKELSHQATLPTPPTPPHPHNPPLAQTPPPPRGPTPNRFPAAPTLRTTQTRLAPTLWSIRCATPAFNTWSRRRAVVSGGETGAVAARCDGAASQTKRGHAEVRHVPACSARLVRPECPARSWRARSAPPRRPRPPRTDSAEVKAPAPQNPFRGSRAKVTARLHLPVSDTRAHQPFLEATRP